MHAPKDGAAKMHSKSVFYDLRSMLYKQEKNAAPRGRQKLRTRVKKKRYLDRHGARAADKAVHVAGWWCGPQRAEGGLGGGVVRKEMRSGTMAG